LYFFTSGIHTSSGQDESSTNIKRLMNQMIKSENPKKPYSDQKIVEMLSEKGIHIARRTVTKYRKALKILPTNLRKAYS